MSYIEPNSERWLNIDDLPGEEWKDIEGFEGLYQISNYGRVKSLSRLTKFYSKERYIPEIIRKNGIDKNGYQILPLNRNGKKYTKKIHRLVAQAFIPNPENKPCVNHKDTNVKNNNMDNLEWCTVLENIQYCCELGKHYNPTVGRFRGDNPLSKKVIQKDKNGNIINVWACAEDVANVLGVNRRSIGKCCRKETKTIKGFIFEYEDTVK